MRDYKKSRKMLNWLEKHGGNHGISFLQETHSTLDVEDKWKQRFKGEAFLSHGSSHSRGVAILLGAQLDYKMVSESRDNDGRLIILLQGNSCLLINSYVPNEKKRTK